MTPILEVISDGPSRVPAMLTRLADEINEL